MDRYVRLAEALLAADNPVYAIAHELGDHAGRIDGILRRLHAVETADEERRARALQRAAT